jgi:hypothetical protein
MNRFAIRSTLVAVRAAFCLVLLIFLAFPSPALAQKRRVRIEEDNHAFRFILSGLGMEPLTDWDQLDEDRGKTILIVFGDTPQALESERGFREFVERGGAVLVATDRATSPEFSKAFGVKITGQFVKTDPDKGYLGKPECPFVAPLKESEISKSLFTGPNGPLERLATNRPSLMDLTKSSPLETLAVFPDGCSVEFLGRDIPIWWRNRPFAAGAELGNGRVLILADHSVFINEMMLQPDNDNFNFAYNCLDWLKEGKRTRVLFYDENEIVTDFKVPIKVINEFPVPPIERMNKLLASLEEENIFNRLILGRNPEYTFRIILRVLAVTLTAGLVLLGFYWLLQNRHRIEVKSPLFAKTAARLAPAPAVIAQRHQALIEEDNLWEIGRDMARDWFADHGMGGMLSPPVTSAQSPASRPGGESMAPATVTSWWKRRALTQKVKTLWKLAYGPPRRLSAQRFARAVADLAQVEEAWKNESLRWIE